MNVSCFNQNKRIKNTRIKLCIIAVLYKSGKVKGESQSYTIISFMYVMSNIGYIMQYFMLGNGTRPEEIWFRVFNEYYWYKCHKNQIASIGKMQLKLTLVASP